MLIHVLTKKGKGYAPAEMAADRGHARAKFDVVTGEQKKTPSNAPSYTRVFADSLIQEAERDEKIVAVTAAMRMARGWTSLARGSPGGCSTWGLPSSMG